MIHLLQQFLLALMATGGFAVIFRVPVRRIPICVTIGALGWVCYEISMYYYESPVLGCFFAACIVGLFSDFASRTFKEASTIFVIPGILCLVPGSRIFYTMTALLEDEFSLGAEVGMETFLMAGAIAVGLLTIGAILRVIRSLIRRTVSLHELLLETEINYRKSAKKRAEKPVGEDAAESTAMAAAEEPEKDTLAKGKEGRNSL